ncbi:hypothetical protein [Pseudoalteromonas mariniglutinosa]|uniref:hypothetical protein n=1 Tax=Pseudoalteromonas mariniglutinosa TaxID=206042 RepID=UPI00384B6EE3
MYIHEVIFSNRGRDLWHALKTEHRDYLLKHQKDILFCGPTFCNNSMIITGYIMAIQSDTYEIACSILKEDPIYVAVENINTFFFQNHVEQNAGFPCMFENLSYGDGSVFLPI